jgi:hypothetical protein
MFQSLAKQLNTVRLKYTPLDQVYLEYAEIEVYFLHTPKVKLLNTG